MAYLSVSDIERELSYSFSTSTEPTDTEIAEFISQVEADLNGQLSSVGVSVPVSSSSSPGSFALLKQAATWGVCARVLGAYGGLITSDAPKAEIYWQRYKDFLVRVRENPAILYDASWDTTKVRVDGITDDDDEYHDAIFAMDDEF